jgi:hypothetical protein
VSTVDRARWRAWGGVADIMGLGDVEFVPDPEGGWIAAAGGYRGHGATGVDALAMLCQRAATRRR